MRKCKSVLHIESLCTGIVLYISDWVQIRDWLLSIVCRTDINCHFNVGCHRTPRAKQGFILHRVQNGGCQIKNLVLYSTCTFSKAVEVLSVQ